MDRPASGGPDRTAKDLFLDVAERSPAARAAVLDTACAGDAALRAAVEALLAAHDAAGSFMDDPTVPTIAAIVPEGDAGEATGGERPGDEIGPYRLVEVIGEGGFGTVWLAEQRGALERRVAIKLIRPGMDSGRVVERFQTERRALARMDHPGIAHVHDAGRTDAGRPYVILEHVRGEPIDRFCDRRELTIIERVELLEQVARAVQHAHGKGIIHRDLKPSNVLVTTVDGRPAPKIIDFGIATAIGGDGPREPDRQLLGTPAYMSPEQIARDGRDVDTRSDVYALGSLLLQLERDAAGFAMLAEALETAEAGLDHDHVRLGILCHDYGGALHDRGRPAEAEPLLARSSTIIPATFGDEHEQSILARHAHVRCLVDLDRFEDALAVAGPNVERARRTLAPDHPAWPKLLTAHGLALAGAERAAEAEPVLREAWVRLRREPSPSPGLCRDVGEAMASLAEADGRPADAARWRIEAASLAPEAAHSSS